MNGTLTKELREALAAEGIQAVEVETTKNGVQCQGFQIDTGSNIKPVVYYSQDENIEAFVTKVRKVVEQPTPDLNFNGLMAKDNILRNSYLCIQKQGDEDIVKRKYLNLELYVRLKIDLGREEACGSTKITSQILDKVGITEDELFEAAKANSFESSSIISMAEALGLMGIPEAMFDDSLMYVGRSSESHGAALLAIPEAIHDFCEEKGYEQLILLPSSTEEILLVPAETGEPNMFANMVAEVNASEVEEVLQLEPCCYLYDDVTQTVSIAASHGEGVL